VSNKVWRCATTLTDHECRLLQRGYDEADMDVALSYMLLRAHANNDTIDSPQLLTNAGPPLTLFGCESRSIHDVLC